MVERLLENIVLKLVEFCKKRKRIYVITGGPNNDTPYLVRYIVFKSKYGCIYIHRFMRSDADDPHDHPWNFLTYIVKGGYKEEFFDKSKPQVDRIDYASGESVQIYRKFWTEGKNIRKAGSLAYKKATDIHRVVVDKPRDLNEIEDAPLTICFMGPRIRDWGFWTDSGIFIDWRKYLNIFPNDLRIEGSE